MASHRTKAKVKKTTSRTKPRSKPIRKLKRAAKSLAKKRAAGRARKSPPSKTVSKAASQPLVKASSTAPRGPASPEHPKKIPSPKMPRAGRGGAAKKTSRRSTLYQRRGPNGELITPGDLLLPGGPLSTEEIQYFFRGAVAAEHGVPNHGVLEILFKRGLPDTDPARSDLNKIASIFAKRFDSGAIEALPPARSGPSQRRTFQSVVERAKQRRREIGAFLRGLHLGSTETSHMDSHGEASLHNLMEWSARIENLIEAEEPRNADYTQFHRGLDHLDNTTEALMVDVELTLRRLRNRATAGPR